MTKTSTYFALLAEFGTADIRLKDCCDKYFGLGEKKAGERARHQQLPVPSYRGGSQKADWLINAADLAVHIDRQRDAARSDWERIHGKAS